MARAPAALRLVADRAARALAAAGVPAAGDGLAAAVSGGADSLALLHAMRTLAGPRGWRLAVVTVDHGLRSGSAADAAFVVDHAKGLGLDARLETLTPADLEPHRRAGQEGAARVARYQALWRAAGELGCGWLATGHTLDDQAETVLLQLLRGAGPDGLAGMPVRSGRLLRPLLWVRRAETRDCCAAVGVGWREDPTNQDPGPLRNRVRQRLLPLLEELRPGAAVTLARAAALTADERDWLDPLVAAALAATRADPAVTHAALEGPGRAGPEAPGPPEGSGEPQGGAPVNRAQGSGEPQGGAPVNRRPEAPGAVALDAGALTELPVALARRVVRAAARQAGAAPPDADATDRVVALAIRSAGETSWPGGRARREAAALVLEPPPIDGAARL
jgi:tRNA(Ile)-lysidine synthase